jgi:hypothetical protein
MALLYILLKELPQERPLNIPRRGNLAAEGGRENFISSLPFSLPRRRVLKERVEVGGKTF